MLIDTKFNIGDEIHWYTWRVIPGGDHGPECHAIVKGIKINILPHQYHMYSVFYVVTFEDVEMEILENETLGEKTPLDLDQICSVTFCRFNNDGKCIPEAGVYKSCIMQGKSNFFHQGINVGPKILNSCSKPVVQDSNEIWTYDEILAKEA